MKPERRAAFYEWHEAAVDHFDKVLGSFDKGKETLFESLASAYGAEIVKRATIKQAELRRLLAESFKIGATKGTGITAPIVGLYTSSKYASLLPSNSWSREASPNYAQWITRNLFEIL